MKNLGETMLILLMLLLVSIDAARLHKRPDNGSPPKVPVPVDRRKNARRDIKVTRYRVRPASAEPNSIRSQSNPEIQHRQPVDYRQLTVSIIKLYFEVFISILIAKFLMTEFYEPKAERSA